MTTSLDEGSEPIQWMYQIDDSHSINAGLNGHSSIIHVASNVSKDLDSRN